MTRLVRALNPGPNTEKFSVHGTDLLIPVEGPNARWLYWFGGDSFALPRLDPAKGWWSPVMFISNAINPYDFVDCNKKVLDYQHGANGVSTKLPTSGLFLGNTMYLHYMIMGPGGLHDTKGTGITMTTDYGRSWTDAGMLWAGDSYGGVNQMRAMIDGKDGYVYHFCSRGLDRDENVIMLRCKYADMLLPSRYEAWGLNGPNNSWEWGRLPWPILPNDVKVMELSVAWVEDKLVLSYARASAPSCIEVRVGDKGVKTNWHTVPVHRPIMNGPTDSNTSLRQLYGGYIIPGSTLKNLKLAVSQWITRTGEHYRVVVFEDTDISKPPVRTPAQLFADWIARFRK